MKPTDYDLHDECIFIMKLHHWQHADPEGGRGSRPPPPPLKNQKNIGFLSNTGHDPMEDRKATKPAFNVGQQSALERNTI